ncbi:DUF3592 domain-containing protein [Paenibacillus sp. NPDC056579]|uniref:DUF3592 domain-containing protein n=1 Tax=Paenibacillus sp. NPDC056579 TaxID=3345871 RepID=UPI00367B14E6
MPNNRTISFQTKISLLFGRVIYLLGWIFLFIGLLLSILITPKIDMSIIHFRGESIEVSGQVTSVLPTNASINRAKIYAVNHQFTIQTGETISGTSYAADTIFRAGDNVSIHYPAGKPEYSRIIGARGNMFPLDLIFVYLFPIAGALFTYFCLRQYIRSVPLLTKGVLAKGTLISKEETILSENKKPVYKLTFQYKDMDGNIHQASVHTSLPEMLEDDHEEALVYDSNRPGNSLMIDSIAGETTIDDHIVHTKPRLHVIIYTWIVSLLILITIVVGLVTLSL